MFMCASPNTGTQVCRNGVVGLWVCNTECHTITTNHFLKRCTSLMPLCRG
jgi:hypothetical protein